MISLVLLTRVPSLIDPPPGLFEVTRMPPDCTVLVPIKVINDEEVPKRSELVVKVAGESMPDTSVLMPLPNVLVGPGARATMEPPLAVAQLLPFTVAKAGPLPRRLFVLPVVVVALSTPEVERLSVAPALRLMPARPIVMLEPDEDTISVWPALSDVPPKFWVMGPARDQH